VLRARPIARHDSRKSAGESARIGGLLLGAIGRANRTVRRPRLCYGATLGSDLPRRLTMISGPLLRLRCIAYAALARYGFIEA
jgi:hypothetical protein